MTLIFMSCSKPLELKGFDKDLWVSGKGGCSSSRIELLDYLKQNNDLFIGVSESDIKEYLGAPDKRDLLPRMGRKHYYYVTPASNCSANGSDSPEAVIIEFEQRGIAKMIIIPSKKVILEEIKK